MARVEFGLIEGESQSKGYTTSDATVAELLKHVGDRVEKGDEILKVETNKTGLEILAPVSGIIAKIFRNEGEEWHKTGEQKTEYGTLSLPALGEIETEEMGGQVEETKSEDTLDDVVEQEAGEDTAQEDWENEGGNGKHRGQMRTEVAPISASSRGRIIRAVPAARHLAREKRIDLSEINGTGPNGLILVSDIESRETARIQEDRYAVPASAVRKEIAELLTYSVQNIPHAGDSVRVCVTSLRKFREKHNRTLKVVLRYDHIFMYLAAQLLQEKEFAVLNGYWDKEREVLVFMKDVNIGFAMHVANARNGESYLAVPVVHRAQDLSFAGLLHAVEDKIKRARSGLLKASEYHGLTFTVNNVGALGGIAPDSIIPSVREPDGSIRPTAMILTLGAFERNAADAEWYMNLGMRFDHRLFDGIEPMTFLHALKAKIENFKFI